MIAKQITEMVAINTVSVLITLYNFVSNFNYDDPKWLATMVMIITVIIYNIFRMVDIKNGWKKKKDDDEEDNK